MKRFHVKFMVLAAFLAIHTEAAANWKAKLTAEGENIGTPYLYTATLGVAIQAEAIPAPPAPPYSSVSMVLYSDDWMGPFAIDVRPTAESHYMWILAIDPNGASNPPNESRTSTISWNPLELGQGRYEIREGYDGNGKIVVADMKSTTSFEVTGTFEQYYSIVFSPAPVVAYDFNGDCDVDGADLAEFASMAENISTSEVATFAAKFGTTDCIY